MVCGGCKAWLKPIHFPNLTGGAGTGMVRCYLCKWRSTWLEDIPRALKPPAPKPRARTAPEASTVEEMVTAPTPRRRRS